jgi:mannosyltransferase
MPSSISSPTSAAADPRLAPTRFWVVAGLESLLAFALAMFHIGTRSIWYDEGVSAVISGSSWTELEHYARTRDPNQSGYHVALHLWRSVLGDTEAALRSLSAVSVAFSVLVLVVLARRLRDDRTALVAGALLAVAPLAIRYGQESRSYTLLMLAVTVGTYCFVRLVDPDDRAAHSWWPVVAYAVVMAYACYLHLFAGFVVVAHGVSLVFVPPAWLRWRRLAASAALLAVLLVPIPIWFVTGYTDKITFIERPGPDDLFHVSSELAGGTVITVLLGLFVLLALVVFGRGLVRADGPRRSRAVFHDGLGISWLVVPFVVSCLVSITVEPVFLGRYLIVSVPALALVAAAGVMAIRPRALAVGAFAVAVASSLVGVALKYDDPIENYRDPVALMAAHVTLRDGLVVCSPARRAPVEYYLLRDLPSERRPVPLSPSDPWDTGHHYVGATAAEARAWVDGGPDRIWLVGHPDSCGFELDGRERTVSRGFDSVFVQRYDRG